MSKSAGISRRTFISRTAGAGAVLTSNFSAPAVLAQTDKPIRIGVLNSFTGAIAYAGVNNFNGMSLYFDSINWTVGGRKIELIKEDDQFNPQVGLQKAKKLIESDNVDMLVGVQASNVALAVLNYMKQQKAFYIVSGAGTDAITWDRYPYLFRTSISAYQLSAPMAEWVYDNLGKEIVLTGSDYAGGRDVLAEFKGPYVKKGGKVLKEIYPPLGTTDFSAYLTDIKSLNPPVTYDFLPGTDAVRFIQQYGEYGLMQKMPLTGFTIIDSLMLNTLGKAMLGVISATTYVPTVDNPESKRFVAAYQAKFNALTGHFFRLRLRRRPGNRRGAEGDQRRHRQRQIGQGPGQGQIRRPAWAVPFRSGNPQPHSGHLHLQGDRTRRKGHRHGSLHRQTSPGPREKDVLIAAVAAPRVDRLWN